ncbi:MAG: hypothetical protein Q3989_05930 [Eubacteriales bacterium]|nr:hypothetical protein [Eubacteriales bacterium]
MADDIKVGGVALELKIDDKRLYSDTKRAADDARKQFSQGFKAAGQDMERSFKSSFRQVSDSGASLANNLTGMFKKLGAAVIAAFSIQKIKEFGQTAIEQAAKVIAQESALTQTFREYEGVAAKAMQEVAKESGILETRLQGVGTQIYAFAKTSGMDSVTALNMMKEALQATADSAAYYDRSLEDTAESLKSFLKGNYANDAALGVSATETTRNAAAMKLYGQSFKDLSEAQKQLTLLQMVKDANALSGAMGQAAREADGWENVIGNLKEAWNQLLAAVGKPILQGAIVVVKRLTEGISSLATYAKAASQALGELFGWSSDETAVTAANTAQTASSISESVDNQNQLTQAVAKTNAEVKRGIAGFDKLNLISKSAANNAPDNSDKIDNVNSISPENYLSKIEIDTDEAENKLDSLKNKIISTFKSFADYSGLTNFADKFRESFDRIDFDYINSNISSIGKNVSEIAKETAPSLAEVNQSFGTLTGSIAGLANTITGKTVEYITGGVRKWLEKDKKYIIDTVKEVNGNLSEGFNNLSPIFDDLRDRAAKFFDKISPFSEGSLAEALSKVTHGFGDLSKGASDAFKNVTGGIKDLYFFMMDDFAPNVWKSGRDLINGGIEAWNSFSASIYDSIRSIGNAIGGFVEGLGSIFGQEWGFTMPEYPPQIPKMAVGGIVSAPTLAVVGDNPGAGSGNPEVIAPLNKLQSIINTSGGRADGSDAKIVDILTRIYETLMLQRNDNRQSESRTYEMNGEPVFKEMVRLNDEYKVRYGRSAF